jgi:hypothetical protein
MHLASLRTTYACCTSVNPFTHHPLCHLLVHPWISLDLVEVKGLTATRMKLTVFWDVASCSLVAFDRRFRGAYCLHL